MQPSQPSQSQPPFIRILPSWFFALLTFLLLLTLARAPLMHAQAQIEVAGAPAPVLSGTGPPITGSPISYTCNTNIANVIYIQTDAPAGQRLWLCDMATGSLAWDHFTPPQQIGNNVSNTGLTGALSATTVCDTSSTCPAGWYELYVYIRPTTTGTLVSAVTANISYVDMVGAVNNYNLPSTCSNLTLLTLVPGSCDFFYYHAANSAVTVQTSVTTLTGSPAYSLYARNVYLGT